MKSNEIDYIARRYRKGRFSANAGWRRLNIAPSIKCRRFRVAAVVAATVIISATAAILYREYSINDASQQTMPVKTVTVSPLAEVKVIDFENAPLQEVINKIESVYSVKVENIPAHPDEYELSLHYEGTPADLISVINEILGTNMTVTER